VTDHCGLQDKGERPEDNKKEFYTRENQGWYSISLFISYNAPKNSQKSGAGEQLYHVEVQSV
jgi:hypothetical protein